MNPQMSFLLQSAPQEALFRLDIHTVISFGIQIVSVAVLFIVLTKLLHKPVTEFLKKREERIENDLQNAEDEKAKAGALRIEYETKVREIEREKEEVLSEARRSSAERAKEIEAAAKSEADSIRARAQKDLELEQERAKAEVKQAIIDCSSVMVAKFLTRTMDAELQEQLFNETVAELEDVAWHN